MLARPALVLVLVLVACETAAPPPITPVELPPVPPDAAPPPIDATPPPPVDAATAAVLDCRVADSKAQFSLRSDPATGLGELYVLSVAMVPPPALRYTIRPKGDVLELVFAGYVPDHFDKYRKPPRDKLTIGRTVIGTVTVRDGKRLVTLRDRVAHECVDRAP